MNYEVFTSDNGKRVFDISPEISKSTAVFPGDTVFSQNVLMDCKKGDNFGLSAFTTTPHIGAHTDAPNHYHAEGVGISERSLNYYFGTCQVISVSVPRGERVRCKDYSQIKISAPRILFKTNSFPNPDSWNGDFNGLSQEVIEHLAKNNVCLVGIDTPSIDPANDKELECHHGVYKNNMAILEGIVLTHVTDGNYQLVALPLKMQNLDASPVRAVLVEL